jgi:hypothetical protein
MEIHHLELLDSFLFFSARPILSFVSFERGIWIGLEKTCSQLLIHFYGVLVLRIYVNKLIRIISPYLIGFKPTALIKRLAFSFDDRVGNRCIQTRIVPIGLWSVSVCYHQNRRSAWICITLCTQYNGKQSKINWDFPPYIILHDGIVYQCYTRLAYMFNSVISWQ